MVNVGMIKGAAPPPAEGGAAAPRTYQLTTMPFPPRFHHRPFLEKNPLGTIPFLVDESNGVEITESCAAAVYAAEAAGGGDGDLLVTAAEREYGTYLNWLFHADATLTFPQTLVLRYRDFEPHKNLQGASRRLLLFSESRTSLAYL